MVWLPFYYDRLSRKMVFFLIPYLFSTLLIQDSSFLDKIFFNVLTRLICENGLTWTIYDGIFYDDESSSISPSTSSEIFNYIFISGSRDY